MLEKNPQNTNTLSLLTLPLALLWPSGWLWLYYPKPEPQWSPFHYSFWSHMNPHWHHNIHDFLWNYKVRDRMAWQKTERDNSEPNWNLKCWSYLGRKNPRALNHLKEACSPLLSTTAWLHLSSQVCQEGAIRSPFPLSWTNIFFPLSVNTHCPHCNTCLSPAGRREFEVTPSQANSHLYTKSWKLIPITQKDNQALRAGITLKAKPIGSSQAP